MEAAGGEALQFWSPLLDQADDKLEYVSGGQLAIWSEYLMIHEHDCMDLK